MFFSSQKEKIQKTIKELSHLDYLRNVTKSIFDYDIPYEMMYSLRKEFIEEILQTKGKVALIEIDGFYYACECFFTGELDPNGFLNDVTVITRNGKEVTFKDWYHNENVTIIFNDLNYAPDFWCDIFADYLTKIDTSLKLAIQNTRIKPIPVVYSSDQKRVVEEVLTQAENGIYKSIVSDDILSEINGINTITTLNITDPKYTETMQYLSKLYDDVNRWFFGIYGLGLNGSGKIAQQTVSEINTDAEAKMVYPFIMLKMRKRGLEMFKNKTGIELSVDFSHPWKQHLKKEVLENGEI